MVGINLRMEESFLEGEELEVLVHIIYSTGPVV
jgi:hypothetical protein